MVSKTIADEREALNKVADFLVGGAWHGTQDGTPWQQSYRWAVGRQFLLCVVNDNELHIEGVNPASKTTLRWIFRANGAVESLEMESITVQKDKVRSRIKEKPNSQATDVVFEMKSAGDSIEINYSPSETTLNTFWASWTDTWTRKPLAGGFPSLASAPPQDAPKWTEKLTGAKRVLGRAPSGKEFYASALGEWILDGKFFLCTASCIGKDHSTWAHMFVFGKDPATAKLTAWEFGGLDFAVGKSVWSDDGMSAEGRCETPGDTFHYTVNMEVADDGTVKCSCNGKFGSQDTESAFGWTYHDVK